MNEKRMTRSTSERMIAGVAGGLADYFNMDPTLVRLILVLLALAGGPGVLIYLILWVVMPEDNI
jgi:phage shock protein C